MGLINIRLGDYIERSTQNNKDLEYGTDLIVGVNSQGIFAVPKGNTDGVDLKPYKIVNNGAFVYNPTRLELGSIAYRTEGLCIVSHLYMVFYLSEEGKKIIDPMWLYIYFRRAEFCREVTFRNFGSQRPEFNFNDMSDIIVPLPDIKIQRKYVNVYNAMLANQQSYERGLEDLKIICDGHFDEEKKGRCISLGELIEKVDNRNSNGIYDESAVRGITNKKQFEDTKANLTGTDLSKFKIVGKDEFAYNSRTDGRDMLVLALNRDNENIIVTFNYNAFRIKASAKDLVNVEYLYAYFKRSEFDRRVRFDSWGSSQELLSWESLCDIIVPLPNIEVQNSIAEINSVLIYRKEINEKLKAQIKDICPILIKGSIEEARKTKEA